MSVTYPADPAKPYGDRVETHPVNPESEQPFVPVYARRGKARGAGGKMKTWMILAPVGVLALGGIGAMMLMNGGDEASTPLAEPALTAPVLPATPTAAAVAPLTTAAAPAPVAAVPVAREAAPARQPVATAPARRESVTTRTPAPRAARVATPAPAVPSGPQSYTPAPAAPSTTTLNTAPATPAPTPPVIIVEPVG